MVDQISRSAARLGLLTAVPVALLAGIGVFAVLSTVHGEPSPPAASPDPETPRPGATGPVTTTARSLTERQQVVCRALLSQLPDRLDGLVQRPVTEGPEQNAAYGDPPITAACGVPPADYPPTAEVFVLSGVCWYPTEEARVWTTVDREVPIRVRVPAGYDAPPQQVIPFSPIIIESVPSVDTAPSGCSP